MPEWLSTSLSSNVPDPSPALLAWRIGMALVLGWAVTGVYRWARRGETVAPTFLATLILLSALIAMATQVIGNSVARAFSLVGALSVVRFRTVVKDTQDTAFVILAVVVGMAAGSDNLAVGLIGLAIVGAAAVAIWPPVRRSPWQVHEATLSLRVAVGGGGQAAVEATLGVLADRVDLTGASTSRKGSSLDLTYRVRLRPAASPTALVAELNLLNGVEDVDLKRGD